MSGKIFISYRRDDSAGNAGRLHDRLAREFGHERVFMDVATIDPGMDFSAEIGEAVKGCQACLVLIGPNWIEARNKNGNRKLHEPGDFVRAEIGAALQGNIPVVPIILEGGLIPKAVDLPEDLKQLAQRQAIFLRHTTYEADFIGLVAALQKLMNGSVSAVTRAMKDIADQGDTRKFSDRAEALHTLAPRPALAIPDKPSIAVLPFANMSSDPNQEYFSDGITEDIITELSRFSELFVIARNSSFTYKGKAVDLRQVGRDLGVRYVLEGSIRRAGERIRITAQLVDATTGAHRWAERYDRELKDVFSVQDEVARTIVSVLAVHVSKAETERTSLKPPATWKAYDYYKRATDIFTSVFSSFSVTDLYEVRRLLRQSLVLDPNYALAYVTLSSTYTFAWINPLDADYLELNTLEKAEGYARKAAHLDLNLPLGRAQFGLVLTFKKENDAAVSEIEAAITINPNFTDWRVISVLVHAGEFDSAVKAAERHMRADPFYIPMVSGWLGVAYYQLERYMDAVRPLKEWAIRAPNQRGGHRWLAATYGQLGRIEEAKREVAEVLRIEPGHTVTGITQEIMSFKHSKDAERLIDGLKKAGLPE